jgi:hypothetical protein
VAKWVLVFVKVKEKGGFVQKNSPVENWLWTV